MKDSLKAALAAIAMLVGVGLAVRDVVTEPSIWLLVWTGLVAVAVSLYFAAPWVKGWFRPQVDVDSAPTASPGLRLRRARESDVRGIAELESRVYSPSDAVPEDVLREWFRANGEGFFVLEEDGVLIGHIDILPIKPATLDLYKGGKIVETEIRGDCLYGPADRHLIRDIYVESVISRPERGERRPAATRAILERLEDIVGSVADPDKVERISAMAATKAGEDFALRLGLKVISEPKNRKDGHYMLEGDFQVIRSQVRQQFTPPSSASGSAA